jgi:O-succinylbenzoate synthase
MSHLQLAVAPFSLPLVKPFPLPGGTCTSRSGLLVRLTDETGVRGYGEASPLAGVHPEELGTVSRVLRAVAPSITEGGARPLQGIRRLLFAGRQQIPTTLHFALEMAAVNLEAARRRKPPAELLAESPRPSVEIQALLHADPADVQAALDQGILQGRSRVKLKIGREDATRERTALEMLDAGLPKDTRLRLDANRRLDAEGVHARIDTLDPARIDYLEEPLDDPAGLAALAEDTHLDIALDESLLTSAGQQIAHADYVGAWIVRPSQLGGVLETLALAKRATESDRLLVIASSLESSVGLCFLAQLAAAIPSAATAVGLGTDRWLAEDLVAPPFDSRSGRVRTDETLGRLGGTLASNLVWTALGETSA